MARSEEPWSGFEPPAASVIAPSALVLGKAGYKIFGSHRPMVGQGIFPARAGGPSYEIFGSARGSGAGGAAPSL